jgi:hypothetical protein
MPVGNSRQQTAHGQDSRRDPFDRLNECVIAESLSQNSRHGGEHPIPGSVVSNEQFGSNPCSENARVWIDQKGPKKVQ